MSLRDMDPKNRLQLLAGFALVVVGVTFLVIKLSPDKSPLNQITQLLPASTDSGLQNPTQVEALKSDKFDIVTKEVPEPPASADQTSASELDEVIKRLETSVDQQAQNKGKKNLQADFTLKRKEKITDEKIDLKLLPVEEDVLSTDASDIDENELFAELKENEDPSKFSKTQIEHNELVAGLIDRLKGDDELAQLEAGIALRDVSEKTDVPVLVGELRKGNKPEVQQFLVETLGRIGDTRALKALLFELQNGVPQVKPAVIDALGYIGHNYPIPALASLFRYDRDQNILKRAAAALGRIKSSKAKGALIANKERVTAGARAALYHAVNYIDDKTDLEKVDTDFPEGQQVQRYYKGTEFLFYRPSRLDSVLPKPWLLVCIHGGDLAYHEIYKQCISTAKQLEIALLVPYFDVMLYPEYGMFNIRGNRADKRLWELIEHVTEHAELQTNEIYFFGNEEGGELVQRLAITSPDRIARAAIATERFISLADKQFFPQGFRPTPFAPDLKLDAEGFIKTDLGLVSPELEGQTKWARIFNDQLVKFAVRKGFTNRIRFMPYQGKFDVRSTWPRARLYLFGKGERNKIR